MNYIDSVAEVGLVAHGLGHCEVILGVDAHRIGSVSELRALVVPSVVDVGVFDEALIDFGLVEVGLVQVGHSHEWILESLRDELG